MGKSVTPRQQRALEALLAGATVAEAAAAAGVARKTVYSWIQSPAFRAELDAAQRAAIEAITRRIVRLAEAATEALRVALEEAPPATRVRAADVLLRRLLEFREFTALEERVAALEAAVERLTKELKG
jgi:phenylpyruvate tautomerase PptA (4-oxalocrotonate tautomerase family)